MTLIAFEGIGTRHFHTAFIITPGTSTSYAITAIKARPASSSSSSSVH